ncbi:dirigent protein [Streptomyces sp. NBC_00076]|uniref:dirigent protein n=1 Tax=Streptomyces sp. NBC_00076 TaxID=2975642 RepID=UPI003866B20B
MRHFKHVGLSAATGLAALLVCSHPALASSNPAPERTTGRERVVQLIAKQTQASSIDVDGSSGPSQGDELVISGDLLFFNNTIGTFGEVCTMTRTAPLDEFDLLCAGSLSLTQGQITFQGRFTVTSAGPGDINLAITGGTGAYRTAHGYINAENVSDTETQLTVHLIR